MTYESFQKGLKMIAVACNKRLDMDDVEILWDLVSFIPESAWMQVAQLCVDRWDKWPRNISMALKEQWYSFQSTHATKEEENRTECQFCHDSTGTIFIESLEPLQDLGYHHKATVRCGHCQNWKGKISEKTKRLTVQEIRQKGYRIY